MKLTFRWYRFPQIGLWLLTAHYDSGNLRSPRGGRLSGDCRQEFSLNPWPTSWAYLGKDQLVQNSTSHYILLKMGQSTNLFRNSFVDPWRNTFAMPEGWATAMSRRWFAAGKLSKVWDPHLYRGPSAGLRCSCWGEGFGSDFPDAPHLGKYSSHREASNAETVPTEIKRLCSINEKKKR